MADSTLDTAAPSPAAPSPAAPSPDLAALAAEVRGLREQIARMAGPEPLAMSLTDTAITTGFTVPGFHNMLKQGKIGPKPARIGRCLRFEVAEVRAWLRAGCPARNRWQHMGPEGGKR